MPIYQELNTLSAGDTCWSVFVCWLGLVVDVFTWLHHAQNKSPEEQSLVEPSSLALKLTWYLRLLCLVSWFQMLIDEVEDRTRAEEIKLARARHLRFTPNLMWIIWFLFLLSHSLVNIVLHRLELAHGVRIQLYALIIFRYPDGWCTSNSTSPVSWGHRPDRTGFSGPFFFFSESENFLALFGELESYVWMFIFVLWSPFHLKHEIQMLNTVIM